MYILAVGTGDKPTERVFETRTIGFGYNVVSFVPSSGKAQGKHTTLRLNEVNSITENLPPKTKVNT